MTPTHRFTSTGQYVTAGPAKEYPDYDKERREHYWIALAVFHMTDPEAKGQQLLDSENLLSIEIGCYFCEEPFTRYLKQRRCPGEPK